MSVAADAQKLEFAERLKRIEQNPGNGRMVTPGVTDPYADKGKKGRKSRPAPMLAKKRRDRRARPGLVWLYGFVSGFVMFLFWFALYPDMATPLNWSASALPLPPKAAAIWVGGIALFGLLIFRQVSLRMGFVNMIGMAMGGLSLAGLAVVAPDLGAMLTSDTFVGQMQRMVAAIELE